MMDFFCQRCSKPLELDESLLDIDQSIFINKDIEEISSLVKEESQNISVKAKPSLQSMSNGLTSQSMMSIPTPTDQSKAVGSSSSSLTKFKSGIFGRKVLIKEPNPNSGNINSSAGDQEPVTPTAATTPTTPNSSTSSSSNAQYLSASVSTSQMSGSPTSFGSLSKHRMGASLTKLPNIDSIENNNQNNQNNISNTNKQQQQQDQISKSYDPSSPMFQKRMIVKSPPQQPRSLIKNSSSSSSVVSKPTTPTHKQPGGISSSSQHVYNSPPPQHHSTQIRSTVASPQTKARLKYLRSSTKSLSMASLPDDYQQSVTQQQQVNSNRESVSVISSPQPSNNVNNPTSPIQTPNNNQSQQNLISSSVISPPPNNLMMSPIGSPPIPNNQNNNNQNNQNNQQNNQNNSNQITFGSTRHHQAQSLFKLVTDLISYDMPLCLECTKAAIGELDDENLILESECEAYSKFLEDLLVQEQSLDVAEVDKEIEKLEQEEEFLLKILGTIQKDRTELEVMKSSIQGKQKELSDLEFRYWSAYSELQMEAYENMDEHQSIQTQTMSAIEKLKKLKETNILNDAFHLWYDGHFGTINSLRLGRLPSQPVEWNEINSAWGLAISLLDNLAKRLSYKFQTFKLVPNGSTSRIEDTTNGAVYELYGSSDISLGRLFWYRRFDNGMVSFLHCLKELCEYVKTLDPSFEVPYVIDKEHINGMHIKVQFTNEDTWTKALKFMLTNLKWILSWVSKNAMSTQPMNISATSSSNATTSSTSSSTSTSNSSSISTNNSSSNNNNNNNNNNNQNRTRSNNDKIEPLKR